MYLSLFQLRASLVHLSYRMISIEQQMNLAKTFHYWPLFSKKEREFRIRQFVSGANWFLLMVANERKEKKPFKYGKVFSFVVN